LRETTQELFLTFVEFCASTLHDVFVSFAERTERACACVRVSVGGEEEEEMSECNVRIRFSFLPFFLSFARSVFLVALSSPPSLFE
jgi:hypothetical protein